MYYDNQEENGIIKRIVFCLLSETEFRAYKNELTKQQKGRLNYIPDLILPEGCAALGLIGFTVVEVRGFIRFGTLYTLNERFKNEPHYYKKGKLAVIYKPNPNVSFPKVADKVRLITFNEVLFCTPISEEERFHVEKVTPPVLRATGNKMLACKKAFKNGNFTLFLGAGVSMSAKLPGWGKLLRSMYEKINGNRPLDIERNSIKLLCSSLDGSTMVEARYLRILQDKMWKEQQENQYSSVDSPYIQCIREALYGKYESQESDLINSILMLIAYRSNVSGVITYNYDDLLETALSNKNIKYQTIFNGNSRVKKNHLPIFHVHGIIPFNGEEYIGNEVILSEDSYHNLYNAPYTWANIEQMHALRCSTCLFIGMSMKDPNLRRLLDAASDQENTSNGIVHYAFLQRTKLSNGELTKRNEETMDQMFLDLGVNVIWYDEHEELPGLLMGLME